MRTSISRRNDEKPDIPVPHFCHLTTCNAEIEPHAFLCERHLQQLPLAVRTEVLALSKRKTHWSEGPSSRWHDAYAKAAHCLEGAAK